MEERVKKQFGEGGREGEREGGENMRIEGDKDTQKGNRKKTERM